MQLFWGQVSGEAVILQGDDARHCSKVLRKNAGDEIEVIDGSGTLFHCSIVSIAKNEVYARVVSRSESFGAVPYHLHLAVAPTKNVDRFEWLLEKATEMGVTSITPILTANAERTRLREDRLQRILVAAAKQSYKGKLPELNPLIRFSDFLQVKHSGLNLIAHCNDTERKPLAAALETGKPITVCIGPEGDFSPEEVEAATAVGLQPVSLGNSRLRTETAGLVAVAAVYNFYSAIS